MAAADPSFELSPAAPPRSPELDHRLAEAVARKGAGFTPRTRHRTPNGAPRFVNRLILEPSPYLQQHAHNPVDWRPWGAEAFSTAEALERPIFLSVGYSTCHWCHVMEEESFDDEIVGAVLNAGFVPIKLDRETHPDVDQFYMLATLMTQGHGGWPNSLWLTPDGKPFFTGTYLPKPKFLAALEAIQKAWAEKRGDVVEHADKLAAAVRARSADRAAAADIGPETRAAAARRLFEIHNAEHGGFGRAQQFPNEVFSLFLLDHWRRTGDGDALGAARASLDAIAAGGVHDHIGGGFHRYAVDVNWRTPHFEKMLYNQGLLGLAFVEAFEATADPTYKRAALRCFSYVMDDMSAPESAFYAAEDADSEGPPGGPGAGERTEGAFYCFSPDQARAALSPDKAAFAIETLGLDRPATLEAGPTPHLKPGAPVDAERLDPILAKLKEARERRPPPLRDDKVIAGWNGLTVRAMAVGAMTFGAEAGDALESAARAADAVWNRLWTGDRLLRLYLSEFADTGEEQIVVGDGEGGLDDYAWLGLGALALSDAGAVCWAGGTAPLDWRARAELLAETIVARFADGEGRYKMSAADAAFGPVYETSDGATPAGESSAAELFALLAARSEEPRWRDHAESLIAAHSGQLAARPIERPIMLRAAAILSEGETTARRAFSGGAVRLAARREAAHVRIDVDVAIGWSVAGAQGGAAPTGEAMAALGLEGGVFLAAPPPTLAGRVALEARLDAPTLILSFQACARDRCAPPVRAVFRFA